MFKPYCMLWGEDSEQCLTPVIVDVNGDGFDFTSLADGVMFDLDADGLDQLTAWTAEESDDAFLFFDYFENDTVDGGHELFGDHASLLSGTVYENGYAALAELDAIEFGGNGDGVITKKDQHFKQLALWNDLNNNGASEDSEIMRLKDIGIEILSLELEYINWVDEHGNSIPYASWAYGKPNKKEDLVWVTADVYFRSQK